MTDRPRVDQLTDDQLDQLYQRIDELTALLHDTEGDRDSWARDARQAEAEADQLRIQRHTYRRAWNSAKARARKHHTRAEKAEAELDALKTVTTGYCPHCGRGDCSPTADQWLEQRQRADKAEDAIARVRTWAAQTQHGAAAAEVLAALDGTT